MRRNYIFLAIYMLVMGAGLAYHNFGRGIAYDSPGFGESFLPVTLTLAVLVIIYWMVNRKSLLLETGGKPGYLWFSIPFVPIAGLAVYAMVAGFDARVSFFIVILDSLLIGIAEEGMFRGILLGGLARGTGPVRAVIVSALFFSLLHALNLLGGLAPSDVLNQMVSTFVMGLFLGAAYLDTRKLWLVMLFHALWDYLMLSGTFPDASLLVVVMFAAYVAEFLIAIVLLVRFGKGHPVMS